MGPEDSQPDGSEGAGHTQARFCRPCEKLPCQLVKKSKGDRKGKHLGKVQPHPEASATQS